MGYQDVTEGALAKSGLRATKFTPERIQQIKDLVVRGTSCEEIAALIGVTAGTLKVTCSKLGISLRRSKLSNGSRTLARPDQAVLVQDLMRTNATFTVTVQYKGEQRTTALPLTLAMIGQLALEASSRDLSIGEFAGDIVVEVLKDGILEQVLGSDRGAATEQF
jgi:GcrA cell cycle regulator